jgi:hypothetical protein
MAQYHKELTKWILITLDKLFMEQSFADSTSRFSAEQLYPLLKFQDGMTETDFLRLSKRPRAVSRQLLDQYFKAGLITKVPDPNDARKRQLMLSENGMVLKQRIHDSLHEAIEFLLGDMTVNEETAVLKFISRINQLTVEKYEIE